VIGIDTESMTDGYAFLIADSRGRYAWIRSFEDVVNFFNYEDYAYCLLVAFNLNFDASVLLKWLGEGLCRELVSKNRISLGSCAIEYVPSKFLQFRFGNRFIRVFDVAQYFQGSLDYNAKQYLHVSKASLPCKSFTVADYDRQDVLTYCAKDAFLAQGLGDYVVAAFNKLDVSVGSLASPANIIETYMLDGLAIRNSVLHVPLGALEFAIRAFSGAWFENFKAGYFPKTYRYDLVSAYPSVIRDLVDLSLGYWVHDKVRPQDALYGSAYAKLTVPKAYISPTVFVNALGEDLRPYGTWSRFINMHRIDWLREHGGKAEINDAWWFVPCTMIYKFKGVVDKFFKVKRQSSSDSMEGWSSKLALAGIYGKFLQHKRGVAGRLYNPVYADEITSRVCLKVADACMQNPDAIIAVMSDCVSSISPLDLPLGGEMGEWSSKKSGESLWIGPAQYEAEGQDDRFRHIPWKKLLTDKPSSVDYEVVRSGPLTLLQGLELNNFAGVGVFADRSVTFNIRKLNWRRFWPERPQCGGDLLTNQYDSRQLCVSSRLKKEDMALWEL
jgi:hypothetical protein